ncbi:hypothetical protein HN937_24495 [Candidatus Poribacteria bacterium]|jgi:hypothetical protein|nr:hypothetical protein [Candidatus Poribacteria bacterium]
MNASLLALTFGVALLVADSHLSAPFRAPIRRPWLRRGLSCVQCVGFWVGLFVSALAWRRGGIFDWQALPLPRIAGPALDALAASGVCGLGGRLIASTNAPSAPVTVSEDGGQG